MPGPEQPETNPAVDEQAQEPKNAREFYSNPINLLDEMTKVMTGTNLDAMLDPGPRGMVNRYKRIGGLPGVGAEIGVQIVEENKKDIQEGLARIKNHSKEKPVTATMEAIVCPPLFIIDGLIRGKKSK